MRPHRKEMTKSFPKLVSPTNTLAFKQLTLMIERRLTQQIRAINKHYHHSDKEMVVSQDIWDNGTENYDDDIQKKLSAFLSDLCTGDIGESMFVLRNTILSSYGAQYAVEQHEECQGRDEGYISDSDECQKEDYAQRVRGIG